jgi:hypothetical protein
MRTTRHTFTVYPPCYRAGDGYKQVHSVFQAKKLALKWGSGSEVWRYTRTFGRKDNLFALSTSTDFVFEVR